MTLANFCKKYNKSPGNFIFKDHKYGDFTYRRAIHILEDKRQMGKEIQKNVKRAIKNMKDD